MTCVYFRPRRYRRRPNQRRSKDSEGEHDGSGEPRDRERTESEGEGKDRRRPQRRFVYIPTYTGHLSIAFVIRFVHAQIVFIMLVCSVLVL